MTGPPAAGSYRLDQLGWLQFEQVCERVVAAEAGVEASGWRGHADTLRVATVERSPALGRLGERFADLVTVIVAWVGPDDPALRAMAELTTRINGLAGALGPALEPGVLVLTNLERTGVEETLRRQAFALDRDIAVFGVHELCASLDRHPVIRAAMPSVLGLRELEALIAPELLARTSLDLPRAQELARIFSPTRAYARAREVLARHRFVVLTGPPEMGKTAIAQMIALAQLTDGWEVHDCTSPEQLWTAFAAGRRQVFVADDAFGSTEYRADAAEHWALALGRLLALLDAEHWLIWTSRPAPLKAGLRRLERAPGAQRLPAPDQVLVDASDLALEEKTLILFRHVKARDPSQAARRLVRAEAVQIVEHPHFTPERIRRFVAERIEELPELMAADGIWAVTAALDRELASPTTAMRTSFHALGSEHRELLMALLDAPAGLIDERELVATLRRHHAGGLSRPPAELIDRLTDHFVRITPLGIGWVHPSWRDLVIDELREDDEARSRFLAACGVHGALLALSEDGGSDGRRVLPLLVRDEDWDAFADRLGRLVHQLDDHDLARILLAFRGPVVVAAERTGRTEVVVLATELLRATAAHWDDERRALPLFALDAWFTLTEWALGEVASPQLGRTWAELYPAPSDGRAPDQGELARIDEWLALAQLLARRDPATLRGLGFLGNDQARLEELLEICAHPSDPECTSLCESILTRIKELATDRADRAARAISALNEVSGVEGDWWAPSDLTAPPSTEPVPHGPSGFTRDDVERVLRDL